MLLCALCAYLSPTYLQSGTASESNEFNLESKSLARIKLLCVDGQVDKGSTMAVVFSCFNPGERAIVMAAHKRAWAKEGLGKAARCMSSETLSAEGLRVDKTSPEEILDVVAFFSCSKGGGN